MSATASSLCGGLNQKPACQMARLAKWIVQAAALIKNMPEDEADAAFAETMEPLWSNFFDHPPETHTLAGAIAALRALLLSEELDGGPERVVRSVLRLLETLP